MSETKRNIAVSGVDTQEKYNLVCKLCGSKIAGYTWSNRNGIVYDYKLHITDFMNDWEQQNYSHCTLYTYEEFIEKFGEKEVSEKLCVSGYGENVYFKKPTFDYAQMCIGSDNLIHGQVLNTNQDKWKLKKWNKETGKVVGSGRNTATYFDLVPTTQYHPDEVAFVSSKHKEQKASDIFPDCDIRDLPDAFIVGSQYKHLKCDTVEWSKQNHTLEQQKAICQFMINKYSMRKKEQDAEDIVKIKFYVEWLEQIAKK